MKTQKEVLETIREHFPIAKMHDFCKLVEEFRPKTVGEEETFVLNKNRVAYGIRRGNISGCIVELSKDEGLVIMQQSNDVLDFVFNALFPKVPYIVSGKRMGKVHTGFYILWKAIAKRFAKRLQKMDPDKRMTFYVAGHSLGAPLGVFAAEYMKENGYKVGQCLFTGAPRMGNKDFKMWIESRHNVTRIINGWDAVTVLPPISLLYRHIGRAFYLFSGKITTKAPLRRNCPIPYLFRGVKDHSMKLYVDNILSSTQIKNKK